MWKPLVTAVYHRYLTNGLQGFMGAYNKVIIKVLNVEVYAPYNQSNDHVTHHKAIQMQYRVNTKQNTQEGYTHMTDKLYLYQLFSAWH